MRTHAGSSTKPDKSVRIMHAMPQNKKYTESPVALVRNKMIISSRRGFGRRTQIIRVPAEVERGLINDGVNFSHPLLSGVI